MGQKTNEIINDKTSMEYKKVFWSANTRSLFLAASLVLGIAFVLYWMSVELSILVVILFSPIFLYRIYDAVIHPNALIFRGNEFIIDDILIKWDQVQGVVFYRPLYSWLGIDGGAPIYYVLFPTYLVKLVTIDNRVIKFSPKMYAPKDLRTMLESKARAHGSNVTVRDL